MHLHYVNFTYSSMTHYKYSTFVNLFLHVKKLGTSDMDGEKDPEREVRASTLPRRRAESNKTSSTMLQEMFEKNKSSPRASSIQTLDDSSTCADKIAVDGDADGKKREEAKEDGENFEGNLEEQSNGSEFVAK